MELKDETIKFIVVNTLPEQGEPNHIYLIHQFIYASNYSEDEVEIVGEYFEEYAWIQGVWCMVGTLACEEDTTEVKSHNKVPINTGDRL